MAFLSPLWLMLAEPSKGIAERSKDIAEHSKGVAERSKGLFNKLCQKGSVLHPPTTHSPTLHNHDNRVVMLPISILRPTL
jgi:hypothetical protein